MFLVHSTPKHESLEQWATCLAPSLRWLFLFVQKGKARHLAVSESRSMPSPQRDLAFPRSTSHSVSPAQLSVQSCSGKAEKAPGSPEGS